MLSHIINEIHSGTQRAPQEHEDKILRTYKRKPKQSRRDTQSNLCMACP